MGYQLNAARSAGVCQLKAEADPTSKRAGEELVD
jgi:hypothetical protein